MAVSLEEQIQQRRSNLAELARLGVEVYPRKFDRTHTVSDLVEQYGVRSHDELDLGRLSDDERQQITSAIRRLRAEGK